MLEEATNKSRYAFYTCAIVAVFYDGQGFKTVANCEREIAKEEKGLEGFGYDPIFFIPDFGKTAAELSREEKNSISHRGKALRKMMRLLREKLLFQDSPEEQEEKKAEGSEKKKEDVVAAQQEKKILVVSDNHRKLDALFKVIDSNPDIAFFLHLGDSEGTEEEIRAHLPKGCESYFVQGNNDFFAYLPKEAELRLGKEKLFLAHGHLYSVNMAVFGHTHKPCSRVVNGVHCFNPGSIAYPRQEDRRPSYGLFYLDKKGNLRSEIKYFG